MNEIWKNIDGYEGLYQVSNLGNVKSLNYNKTGKERILKPGTDKCGYRLVGLFKNGKLKFFTIHRLVANSFLENPDHKPEVNHKDEDKTNNCVENLEWMTRKENNNYGTRTERVSRSLSKLVLQFTKNGEFIRKWQSTRQIERELGFSIGNISGCCKGKRKSAYGYIWTYV